MKFSRRHGKVIFSIFLLTLSFSFFGMSKAPKNAKKSQTASAIEEEPASIFESLFQTWAIQKSQISDKMKAIGLADDPVSELPEKMQLEIHGKPVDLKPQYTVDAFLQKQVKDLIKQYKPDYAAFVAIEPETGRVLAFVSSAQKKTYRSNVALAATYPAASVFKMVTASAAIETKQFKSNSEISFSGNNHTLYRRNVNSQKVDRWTRSMSLKEAFGKSVNTVFAKIGLFHVGGHTLQAYAEKFGFNHSLHFDLPVSESRAIIPDNDWGVAEAASGFTTDIMMSPVQGAMMAAAIANDGVMMEPYVVHKLFDGKGELQYKAKPKILRTVLGHEAADEVKKLMNETVEHGTSKKFFKPFIKLAQVQEWDVGGKTGSLTGLHPFGKYDWFVGYANFQGKKVAVSALTIHEKYWKVKSAFLARRAFESFLKSHYIVPKSLRSKYALIK
ncbi:MAG: hypothetical protein KA715_10420 [Xanthomonadaceae bacterium]|nr:hypothetical protein [Xanthomonadaceae bacterium]